MAFLLCIVKEVKYVGLCVDRCRFLQLSQVLFGLHVSWHGTWLGRRPAIGCPVVQCSLFGSGNWTHNKNNESPRDSNQSFCVLRLASLCNYARLHVKHAWIPRCIILKSKKKKKIYFQITSQYLFIQVASAHDEWVLLCNLGTSQHAVDRSHNCRQLPNMQ